MFLYNLQLSEGSAQRCNEDWGRFDVKAEQQNHLPWLKWGRLESLSQAGRFQSWSGWTRFSLVTWTFHWSRHRPISETQMHNDRRLLQNVYRTLDNQTTRIGPFVESSMTAVLHLDGVLRDGLLFVLCSVPFFCLVCLPLKWLWHHSNSRNRRPKTRSRYTDTKPPR